MTEQRVGVTLSVTYQVFVDAVDADAAYEEVNLWVSDDLSGFLDNAELLSLNDVDIEVEKNETEAVLPIVIDASARLPGFVSIKEALEWAAKRAQEPAVLKIPMPMAGSAHKVVRTIRDITDADLHYARVYNKVIVSKDTIGVLDPYLDVTHPNTSLVWFVNADGQLDWLFMPWDSFELVAE